MIYPIIAAVILCSILTVFAILLLKFLHPSWWKSKIIRRTVIFLPTSTIPFIVIWYIGTVSLDRTITKIGSFFTATVVVLMLAIVISLIFSSVLHTIDRIIGFFRKKRATNSGFDPQRRAFLTSASAVIPVAMIGSSVYGVIDSNSAIRVPYKKLPVKNLPANLEGLRIAHLSDSHLGYYVHLDNLEKALATIATYKPGLILYTGDISDDLDILLETLKMVDSLKPPFGIFASIGNHEYYRGIRRVLKIFESAPFPLLLNSNASVRINGVDVVVGGADDPVNLRRDNAQFLQNTIDKTMSSVSNGSFKILMTHRPEGLDHASTIGVNLVLGGHTHGAQIGFAGRSLLEPLLPHKYLWGIYQKNGTTLYTSGGMGHWLPFRLGVPAEAPILELTKA